MRNFLELVEQENLFRLRASIDTLEDREYVDILRTLREAGKYIGDPKEREWLATAARRWSNLLYDRTGAFHSANLAEYREDTIEDFNPDLFVGREAELEDLTQWATADTVPRRLNTIVAPSGYGKSWLLAQLERHLSNGHGRDLFLIRVSTSELKSRQAIADWLLSIIEKAQMVCSEVRDLDPTADLDIIIALLLEDLCQNCSPFLRPILLMDAFDELFDNERREVEKHLLERFWFNSNVRIVMAFRDELALKSPNLRRSEVRTLLQVFEPEIGQEQLQRLAAVDPAFNPKDLIPLIPPYNWTHPKINTYLYETVKQRFLNHQSPLLTADDLRNCWLSLVELSIQTETLDLEQLEADLKAIAAHSEDSWTLGTFAQIRQYDERVAIEHLQTLMVLSFVSQMVRQKYMIVDGFREIIRAELRLRETGNVIVSLLPVADSEIGGLLRGQSPFKELRAEAEINFLFGESGGFWSGHPTYADIFDNLDPQLIVGEDGSGKTAFASALERLGNPEGVKPDKILPIYIDTASIAKIQNQIIQAIKLEKPFLENEAHWLAKIRTKLSELGLEKILLSIDPDSPTQTDIQEIIDRFDSWATEGLIIKLFLNPNKLEPLVEMLPRSNKIRLTWTDEQLDAMAQWRFERLITELKVYANLETLFDEGLYSQFIQHAQGSPRRLAQLWRYMFEHYRRTNPNRIRFSTENLAWAVKQLQ